MKKHVIKLVLFIFIMSILGCVTPISYEWFKDGHSKTTTKEEVQDCKYKTYLYWPFVTYQRCMKKRGYILVKKRKATKQKPVNNKSDFQKLIELKQLKDKGIISDEEFEEKEEVSFKILTLGYK